MIVHKTLDVGEKVVEGTPAWVGWFVLFFVGWAGATALWFFPLSRIVIDAGPKGDSNGMANMMEVLAVMWTLVMLVASAVGLFTWEERILDARAKRAEKALAERVALRRLCKQTEAEEGLPPYPWDDEIEAIIKKQDERREYRMLSYSLSSDPYPLSRTAREWQQGRVSSWS